MRHLTKFKTLINQLYNMITLSSDVHNYWPSGDFILEPLLEEYNIYELKVRFLSVAKYRSTFRVSLRTDPASLTSPSPSIEPLYDIETDLRIQNGQIITLRTTDPMRIPLPSPDLLLLQCHLIRVLRMAGRAGNDMLEAFDSDHEVSSVTAMDFADTEQNKAATFTHETPRTRSSDPKKSLLVRVAGPLKSPFLSLKPQEHRTKHRGQKVFRQFWSRIRTHVGLSK